MSGHGCGDPRECPTCQLAAALAKVAELEALLLEARAIEKRRAKKGKR